jgi:hypothetical protein
MKDIIDILNNTKIELLAVVSESNMGYSADYYLIISNIPKNKKLFHSIESNTKNYNSACSSVMAIDFFNNIIKNGFELEHIKLSTEEVEQYRPQLSKIPGYKLSCGNY